MLALWLGLAAATEFRAATGGEYAAEYHGMLDFGVRGEDWSAELLTDTLDARWTPEGDRGKAWVGGRVAGFAAGLQISPWTDGRPDPERALIVSYAGVEAGAQRYLKAGFYAGIEGHARRYLFNAMPTTAISVPDHRPVVHADEVLGWYRDWAHVQLRPGLDLAPGSPTAIVQPHAVAAGQLDPGWPLSPRLEIHAGWADSQDDVTKTRLGGLNPYSVPLAGAAWAEFWVTDYAAVRAGPELTVKGVRTAPLVDAAWFDGQTAWAVALDTRVTHERFFTDLDVGWAPTLPRPDGHSSWGLWYALGVDWGPWKR